MPSNGVSWMPSSDRWLLKHVVVQGVLLDCRLRDGAVAQLAPGLVRYQGESLLEAHGGELLPGLSDHHVHLRALAASVASIDLRGGALGDAVASGTGWLRIIGAGTELSRSDVDEVFATRPVRVQHRSGALWTLNSRALDLLAPGATDDELRTGQFWRNSTRLRALLPTHDHVDLTETGRLLSSHGITHVTDATPHLDPAGIAIDQHLLSLATAGDGPLKIVIPDHEPPEFDHLRDQIARTHASGRGVAVHAVTSAALAMFIAALDSVGPHDGDRVEHAAVCDDAAAARLSELGVTVVTQPTVFARHRESFLAESDNQDRAFLWRYAGLLRAGVKVVASSDAPYGDLSPWETIRTAVTRDQGRGESVDSATVLSSMQSRLDEPAGPPRQVAVGEAADLCLLSCGLTYALRAAVESGSGSVASTFVQGRLVYPAPPARS